VILVPGARESAADHLLGRLLDQKEQVPIIDLRLSIQGVESGYAREDDVSRRRANVSQGGATTLRPEQVDYLRGGESYAPIRIACSSS